ncbi:uncharacterized protein LOC117586253 [Drosophila guanche]|uniref:Uncharacterized protein n=1 Tax=Drosophila guanche TaxID=7266 RepID=A0A3B0K8V1_DROGU|nr:uncharacterized protein LOC117586253 [Drosophila guanche]SPP84530.1 Hypothetical predicted protein [Drosophila guanche]
MNNFGEETAQSVYPVEDPENDLTRRSDDDEAEPLRVQEMIKLYNFATEKNQELKQAKSFYRAIARIQEDAESCHSAAGSLAADEQSSENITDKECNDAITTGSFYVTTTEDHTLLRQCLMSNSGKDGSKPVGALEKTYSSSTTIRRTEQGVRIIIDIFCDSDDNTIDVVGGLVETKIPPSRILTEFQNQCMGLGPKDIEGEQKASASSHF